MNDWDLTLIYLTLEVSQIDPNELKVVYNTAEEFHYNMEVSQRIRALNLPQAYTVFVDSGLN